MTMQTQEKSAIEKLPKTEKRYYTPEEYLALEETAINKSEYHDGKIIPITGGTTNHNSIIINCWHMNTNKDVISNSRIPCNMC